MTNDEITDHFFSQSQNNYFHDEEKIIIITTACHQQTSLSWESCLQMVGILSLPTSCATVRLKLEEDVKT